MLKLVYYVPESHLEITKSAIFKAGAGTIGEYQHCCWQIKGTGQFMPSAQAHPFIGQANVIAHVDEWRVETILPNQIAKIIKKALLDVHPYEVPAYDFIEIVEI